MRLIKLLGMLAVGAAAAGLLASCGQVKSEKELLKRAKQQYGKCTLISSDSSDKSRTVRVRDELQGFEYKLTSGMNSIDIDGSHFGSVQRTTDDFLPRLGDHIRETVQPEVAEICSRAKAEYEFPAEFTNNMDPFLIIRADDPKQSEDAALACAAVIQKQNLRNRFDQVQISVYTTAGEMIGFILLPGNVLTEAQDENARIILNEARNYCIASKAGRLDTFSLVRMEHITFADTGLPLERLQPSPDFGYVKNKDQPVTVYYFSYQGKEFFIMNFEDTKTSLHYTNFREVFPEK